jgi:hypothetical protein
MTLLCAGRFRGFVLGVVAVLGLSTIAWATVPDGYKGIKLGMQKSEVLTILKKDPVHFSFEEIGTDIGEIIRSDDLFRYATYRFDSSGSLAEIGLDMREVLGRDRVLELYNSQHGVNVSPAKSTVQDDRLIEVRGNRLILRKAPTRDTRAAEGAVVQKQK